MRHALKIDPIGSNIPSRGFAQLDIELFGLTYLQKISDSVTGGALHIEPGIWVTQPETTEPPVAPPPSGQIVARLATIPHGNAALIQGSAILIPELAGGTFDIPPVNTAPFPAGGSQPPPGTQGGFPAYNLADSSPAAVNFRTPFGNNPAVPLPTKINTISLQKIINDPTRLLQQAIKGQNIKSMVLIRISTADDSTVPDSGGRIENIPFLTTNADVATVDATFWLETIEEGGVELLQLQYVQTVMLNFPVLNGPEPQTLLSWPHVSIATLRKSFG